MVSKCVAFGCNKSHKDGVRLFKFPKDPKLQKKWIKQVFSETKSIRSKIYFSY